MKNNNMKAPAVTELFQRKMLYQTHLKKLQKIRQDRKHQLANDTNRLSKHEEIIHSKSRSFAHKYNEQHHQITQSNIKLLDKLQKVKPFTRYSSYSTYEKDDSGLQRTMTPLQKRRDVETEKENNRIFIRVKSVSSSLSKDKLLKDFARSQQIKTRIARYATQNNRVSLKSERFVNLSMGDNPNIVSHYNHQDILKNRIDNPRTEMKNKQKQKQEDRTNNKTFFTTEPVKSSHQRKQKKIGF